MPEKRIGSYFEGNFVPLGTRVSEEFVAHQLAPALDTVLSRIDRDDDEADANYDVAGTLLATIRQSGYHVDIVWHVERLEYVVSVSKQVREDVYNSLTAL